MKFKKIRRRTKADASKSGSESVTVTVTVTEPEESPSLVAQAQVEESSQTKASIEEELLSTLRASQLIYRMATLRSIVRKYEETHDETNPRIRPKGLTLHKFNNPELIFSRDESDDLRVFQTTYLKYPVSIEMLLNFIQENRHYLTTADDGTLEYSEEGDGTGIDMLDHDDDCVGEHCSSLPIEEKLKAITAKYDADIVEFDDEYASNGIFSSELVYSIVVDRTEKRVTVVFRGSVTASDWLKDFTAWAFTPPDIAEFAKNRPKIHGGFGDYLFGNSDGSDCTSKFDEIIANLQEIYAFKDEKSGRDYSNYSLMVTGHSLGGALAQLLAFTLAGSPRATFLSEGHPVIAVTYASPSPGNKLYHEIFKELEKEGKLAHIRISNYGDIVPVFNDLLGYKQAGINMYLNPVGTKLDISYHDGRACCFPGGLVSPSAHSLKSHRERLFQDINMQEYTRSIEYLYKAFADGDLD